MSSAFSPQKFERPVLEAPGAGVTARRRRSLAPPAGNGTINMSNPIRGRACAHRCLCRACREPEPVCVALAASRGRPHRTPLATRNHWRNVRKVRGYLEDHHLAEALSLQTLCQLTGVGARTLNTAFQEVTGDIPCSSSNGVDSMQRDMPCLRARRNL
jgi:hypothetical protein